MLIHVKTTTARSIIANRKKMNVSEKTSVSCPKFSIGVHGRYTYTVLPLVVMIPHGKKQEITSNSAARIVIPRTQRCESANTLILSVCRVMLSSNCSCSLLED